MPSLFPLLLGAHIALAVGLFVPSILLPFTLRIQRRASRPPGSVVAGLIWLQAHGTTVVGVGLAATGLGLVAVLGPALFGQPWLLVALSIYAANLAIAFFIQRPNLRRLLGVRPGPDDRSWREGARRQRYLSYAMTALVGTIGYLMTSKPQLW